MPLFVQIPLAPGRTLVFPSDLLPQVKNTACIWYFPAWPKNAREEYIIHSMEPVTSLRTK